MKEYKVELSSYDKNSNYETFSGIVEANSKTEVARILNQAAVEDGKTVTIRQIETVKK